MPKGKRPRGLGADFGLRLRAARQAARDGRGLGQAELAAALGISQATVSDYERGRRQPPLGTLAHLADVLGVPAGWLISGSLGPEHRLGAGSAPGGAIRPDDMSAPALSEPQSTILRQSLAGLLGLSVLLYLGKAGLAAVPANQPGQPEMGRLFPVGRPAQLRAAEERTAYGGFGHLAEGEALVLTKGLCAGARQVALYVGPETGDIAPGDLLLVDPDLNDPRRWRVVAFSPEAPGSGTPPAGTPGGETRWAIVPAGADLPEGSDPCGAVLGLFRRTG